MDISGEYLFDVPRHMIWNALQEPKVLEAVLPGAQRFEQVGENQYSGVLSIKVGPVQGTFQGQIRLYDFIAPESYWMDVEGQSAVGVVKASGRLQLRAQGNRTHMEYAGQAHVGGRIASVGNRLIENSARSLIRQGLETLHERLKTEMKRETQENPRVSSAPSVNEIPIPAPSNTVSQATGVREYKSPVQMTSAPQEEQEGFWNRIFARYQLWLIGAAVIIVFIILFLVSHS